MSALEQEIMEKFHQLQPAAKQRVLALIKQEVVSEVEQTDLSEFNYSAWFQNIEVLRQQIRASHGDELRMDVVGMLRDIRDGEDE